MDVLSNSLDIASSCFDQKDHNLIVVSSGHFCGSFGNFLGSAGRHRETGAPMAPMAPLPGRRRLRRVRRVAVLALPAVALGVALGPTFLAPKDGSHGTHGTHGAPWDREAGRKQEIVSMECHSMSQQVTVLRCF